MNAKRILCHPRPAAVPVKAFSMSSESILVTGGAGYIGSHACKALHAAGFRPVVLDNLSTGHADAVRWGPLIRADVRDADAVGDALRRHDARLVMHFAARAYVGESVADPGLYYDNNVHGMTRLLAACREAGVTGVVFSSSCATYGAPRALPMGEDTPQHPVNPYGETKLVCEWMLKAHEVAHGLRHVSLRYFNAAGADPDGELGERHDPETHLIPLALLAAAGRRDALHVFGTDYDTPDGTCIRDYIHVSDLARAHVLAATRLARGGASLAVNLGSGIGHSVREILTTIRAVTGHAVPGIDAPRRAGDPPVLLADISRAARELDFHPERSDIRHIIADAAPWFGFPRER